MYRFAHTGTLVTIALFLPLASPTDRLSSATGRILAPPNIVIIVTDDQRSTDTLAYLPRTRKWFRRGGTEFTNAYATTPLCCPSRASIFTGQFVHNHQVKSNADSASLDHGSTIQRHLKGAGYSTAIVGKFLNGWGVQKNPPHFDRWAIMKPAYWNTRFNVDGTVETIEQYSTDYIADQSARLIQDFDSNDDQPWFLYVAPYAPHGPYDVEPDYQNADVGEWDGNPAVFEEDKSDKPQHVQRQSYDLEHAREIRQGQLRLLMSVDDLVEQLFRQLKASGERNTLAFFISDNSYFWSEHGITGKNRHAYTQGIEVPFFMRWPRRVAPSAADDRLVANIDIAPTIMDVTGIVPSSGSPPDGQSLLGHASRDRLLIETWARNRETRQTRAFWASLRSVEYQYIQTYKPDGVTMSFEEYYELAADPWQLENLLADGDPSNDPDVRLLREQLDAARSCSGIGCNADSTLLLEKDYFLNR